MEFYHRERFNKNEEQEFLCSSKGQGIDSNLDKTTFDALIALNGPKLWNILSKSANSAVTLHSFKVHL